MGRTYRRHAEDYDDSRTKKQKKSKRMKVINKHVEEDYNEKFFDFNSETTYTNTYDK